VAERGASERERAAKTRDKRRKEKTRKRKEKNPNILDVKLGLVGETSRDGRSLGPRETVGLVLGTKEHHSFQ